MNIELLDKIIELIERNPEGLKATAIAVTLFVPRRKVNRVLYSNPEIFEMDERYVWTVKNTDNIIRNKS